jgi:putative membrane protein
VTTLADGEWHRLHPASPLLRGGLFVVAVLGFIVANLRERLIDLFFGVPSYGADPLDRLFREGAIGWAVLVVAVVLVLLLVGFYLSWRMHTFRVSGEVVEVRSGLVFRSNRRARLDRIQGVNIGRPFIPRLFGVAKLEVSVAGQDANVQLAYLGGAQADALRREILHLASGARAATVVPEAVLPGSALPGSALPGAVLPEAAQPDAALPDAALPDAALPGTSLASALGNAAGGIAGGIGGFATDRAHEFFAPELDPDAAPPESVVRIPHLRLIGSVVFSGFTAWVAIGIGVIVYSVSVGGSGWLLVAILPGLIGSVSYYVSRFTKSLRYSIAGTPDGVRVGFGLLSMSNETLPPGRIHAVMVSQPILWRTFGWWQVRINTAGHSTNKGAAGEANTTTLPVGTLADVAKVLELILPGFDGPEQRLLIDAGMRSPGGDPGYTNAPRRAAWLRPFSWRRTGFAVSGGTVLLRRGLVSRELVLVPLARLQSIGLEQGPIRRMLRLAKLHVHTVAGPVAARLPVLDAREGERLFERLSAGAISSARADTSHHWADPGHPLNQAPTEPRPLEDSPTEVPR